jgi:hypothetical protein
MMAVSVCCCGAEGDELQAARAARDWAYKLQSLASNRECFAEGKRWALLLTISTCFQSNIPVPAWAKAAFIEATDRGWGLRGGLKRPIWNEVFGKPPRTKGQHDRYQRDVTAPLEIYRLVRAAKQRRVAINDDLFQEVGSRFNLSSTQAKKLYAAERDFRKAYDAILGDGPPPPIPGKPSA